MFSLNRMYANAILPEGKDYTFWGRGVSQGHSDAIRRIPGVKDAKQYTIPVEAALASVRAGENPDLSTREKHTRECFVVLEEGADAAKVEETIKTMPKERERETDSLCIPGWSGTLFVDKNGLEHTEIFVSPRVLGLNATTSTSIVNFKRRGRGKVGKEGYSRGATILAKSN